MLEIDRCRLTREGRTATIHSDAGMRSPKQTEGVLKSQIILGLFVLLAIIGVACGRAGSTATPTPTSVPQPTPTIVTYELEVIVDPKEAAVFILNPRPDSQGRYAAGTTVAIDILPTEGWEVEEWVGPAYEVTEEAAKVNMDFSQSVAVRLVRGEASTASPTATSIAPATPRPTATPQVIKFSDQSWDTLWLNNAIAMYVTEQGYGYPVEEVVGATGTMKVALPIGDLDVAMEMWRTNIRDWYDEFVVEKKQVVDLAGTKETVANGAKGQTLEATTQGWYVPAYVIAQNPGLKSVSDLPNYEHLFTDPEDASKGVWVNCIIGWECQKRYRAKALAYGLNEHYNVIEPGSSAALAAAIKGAYEAGEPVLSYYWEPTKLLAELDMVQLEEPPWTQACADAISAGTRAEPYESTIGCHDALDDVHTGVTASLMERAPEVVEFLGNLFVGSLALEDLAAWKKDNDKEWRDAAVKWLQANEAQWTRWVTPDAAAKVKTALADEQDYGN